MTHRILLFFLLLLFAFNPLKGQEKEEVVVFGDSSKLGSVKQVVLTGTIVQADSKTPLGGASIFLDGLKYGNNSDYYGRYLIELPPGTYRLTVRYLGNIPIHKKISIFQNGVLHFEMVEKPKVLEEVIISARTSDENIKEISPGLVQLGIKEIKRIPALMGEVDVVKSLLLLPGITTVGEGSGGFNVRGGATDQNLVLMDNGQIFNSAHALGLFSNFNPDVTEEFTLYKGNIPAQYGGRASSVLNVRTRDGDFSKFHVKGGVGFLSGRAAVEGPIVKDKTSFLVGGRVSYSDWILKTVKNLDVQNSSASFYDFNANVTHRFSSGGNISLRYYQGHDYFRYSNQFGYDYTTQLLSLRWNALLGKNWGSTFTAAQGKYTSKLFDFDVTQAREFSNGISYTQLKQNFLHTYKEVHALNLGAEANLYASLPEKSQPLGTNSTTTAQQLKKSDGREFSLYANEEYTLSKVFSFSIGLRYSLFQSLGNDTVYQYQPGLSRSVGTIIDTLHYSPGQVTQTYQGFEPRFSVRIGAGKNAAFKIAYNRNRQYIHLVSNTTAPTPTDIWQLSNAYFKPQIADNFSFGFFQNFKENKFEFSAEVFYKSLTNIVDYKNSAQIILNRHLETDVLQGKGKYYGLELYVKKNTGFWRGWASYTFSRAFNQINGVAKDDQVNSGNWYPSNYDKPHNFSLTASHYLGRHMTFAANLTYTTGRPITAIESYYYGNEISIPVYSERNKYRIPDYWRVDISVTVNSVFKKIDDNLVFSIYNFFGRRNAYSIYYQEIYGQQTLQAYKLSVLGSALPSITYNINF